jgi:DNA repair protein RadC
METDISHEIKISRVRECPSVICDSAEKALTYWKESVTSADWFSPERENILALILNTRLQVTGHSIVSIGTLSEAGCHPRDVFRAAIALNAYGILLMHNHPSGDSSPSAPDYRITRALKEGAGLLQINLVDHVIVGDSTGDRQGYFSFKEAGVI